MSVNATIESSAAVYRNKAAPFLPILLVPVAYGISQYAAGNSAFAEQYIRFFTRYITSPVSIALGVIPFSIAEIWLVLTVVGAVFTMIMHLLRANWLQLVAYPLALASLLYAFFAAGWGIAYSREPYSNAAGLVVEPVAIGELEALCMSLAERANELRLGADEDENGVYKTSVSGKALLWRVQSAYDAASERYPWLAGRYGNPKPVTLSVPMSYLDISGIFVPYTLEANVNMNNLDFMIPMTACHEAAHQRGWAREDEANYISYAVCMQSGDRDFMYSGTLLGLIHAMNALSGANSELYWSVQALYGEGLVRDLNAHYDHWKQYEGKVSELSEQINDAYLRVNRQEDGVRSYGRMVDLMVAAMKSKR